MAAIPPPQGMSEIDYEAIEAAVTETVRGRWFLSEYARRNRLAETRQLLDAMARLEAVVTAGQPAMPSADPSIRLLIQRIKEIAGQLGSVAGEMRAAGVEDRLVEAVDIQARAVAGMMRSASVGGQPPGRSEPARLETPRHEPPVQATASAASVPRMPRVEPFSAPRQTAPREDAAPPPSPSGAHDADPRLAALAEIDGMPLARKLALFT